MRKLTKKEFHTLKSAMLKAQRAGLRAEYLATEVQVVILELELNKRYSEAAHNARLANLNAQNLQVEVQEMMLELSKKYGSVDKPLNINFDTGEILET